MRQGILTQEGCQELPRPTQRNFPREATHFETRMNESIGIAPKLMHGQKFKDATPLLRQWLKSTMQS